MIPAVELKVPGTTLKPASVLEHLFGSMPVSKRACELHTRSHLNLAGTSQRQALPWSTHRSPNSQVHQ